MPQARISIVLTGDDYKRLAQLAGREMRHPRDQAAYLLLGAIRREEPTGTPECPANSRDPRPAT